MTLNDFSKYFKSLSNTELLEILENQENYQPFAIEAAKNEIEARKLSEVEIAKAKEPIILKQLEKENQEKKIKAVSNKVKNVGNTVIETLNPIQDDAPTPDNIIRLISIVFWGIYIYNLFTEFGLFLAIAQDLKRFDSSSFFYLFPFIIVPIATVSFQMKKTIGWILLSFFIIYTLLGQIWMLVDRLKWHSNNIFLEKLFPQPTPVAYILHIGFLIGIFYVISKPNIREVFKINKSRFLATTILSGLVTIFVMLVL